MSLSAVLQAVFTKHQAIKPFEHHNIGAECEHHTLHLQNTSPTSHPLDNPPPRDTDTSSVSKAILSARCVDPPRWALQPSRTAPLL